MFKKKKDKGKPTSKTWKEDFHSKLERKRSDDEEMRISNMQNEIIVLTEERSEGLTLIQNKSDFTFSADIIENFIQTGKKRSNYPITYCIFIWLYLRRRLEIHKTRIEKQSRNRFVFDFWENYQGWKIRLCGKRLFSFCEAYKNTRYVKVLASAETKTQVE